MSIYKIEPLLSSGFNFNEVFPDKQEALKSFGGYNFGLQEIAQLLRKQTDNFKSSIPVALDIDKYLYEAYEKFISGKKPKEEPAPAPAPAMTVEEEIKSIERKIRVYTLGMRNASADEKASIERKIRVYKIRLRGLENKKEKGGAVILTGTQSAGDPTSNMGETVATVDYSVGDPEQMADGSELKHENAKEKAVKAIWHGRKSLKVYLDGGYKSPLDLYERNLLSRANRMLNKIILRDSTEISEYEYSLVQDLEFITREVINTDGNLIPMDRQNLVDVIDEAQKFLESQVGHMAKGGGFEKLAHHVAHEYEGTKVPAKYQKVYHEKRYSHESAEEVGRKVAAKVYREQQSHQ